MVVAVVRTTQTTQRRCWTIPVSDAPGADITISFSMVNLHGSVTVYDIWEQKSAGAFTGSYTVRAPATLAS